MPGQHFHSYSTCAKGQTASIHAISLLEVCMEIPLVKDFSRAVERRRRLFVAVEFEIEKNKPLLFHVGDAADLRLSFSLSAFVVARNFFCIQYISIFFYTGIYLILILTYSGYISYREHFLFFISKYCFLLIKTGKYYVRDLAQTGLVSLISQMISLHHVPPVFHGKRYE